MGVAGSILSKQQRQEQEVLGQEEHSVAQEDAQSIVAPENTDSIPLLSQSLSLNIDDGDSPLSTGISNNVEELHVPRSIISSSLSKSSFKAELLRPLITGNFNGEENYYLLKLRFDFQAAHGGYSWSSRIRSSRIQVVLEDAPIENSTTHPKKKRPDRPNPVIVKVYPDSVWEGPISSTVGLRGASPGTASVRTMTTGRPQCNILVISVTEHPKDASGIPASLIVPVIVCHHKRRFGMSVTVNATFGFWRGTLASIAPNLVPVLGGADEPLYFDPVVLGQKETEEEKDIIGVKYVKRVDALDGIDLQKHSSLISTVSSRYMDTGIASANW